MPALALQVVSRYAGGRIDAVVGQRQSEKPKLDTEMPVVIVNLS